MKKITVALHPLSRDTSKLLSVHTLPVKSLTGILLLPARKGWIIMMVHGKGCYKRQVLWLAFRMSDLPLEKSPAMSVK